MPAARRWSHRDSRGRGWHKRGYRKTGCLFFQLKRSYAGFSREHDVNENESISELIWSLHRDVSREDPALVEGLHYEFYCRRRLLMPSEEMVKTLLDGGETVYAKAFDDEGNEYECDIVYNEWVQKPRRGQRRV